MTHESPIDPGKSFPVVGVGKRRSDAVFDLARRERIRVLNERFEGQLDRDPLMWFLLIAQHLDKLFELLVINGTRTRPEIRAIAKCVQDVARDIEDFNFVDIFIKDFPGRGGESAIPLESQEEYERRLLQLMALVAIATEDMQVTEPKPDPKPLPMPPSPRPPRPFSDELIEKIKVIIKAEGGDEESVVKLFSAEEEYKTVIIIARRITYSGGESQREVAIKGKIPNSESGTSP